jgi:hypothetical protein
MVHDVKRGGTSCERFSCDLSVGSLVLGFVSSL